MLGDPSNAFGGLQGLLGQAGGSALGQQQASSAAQIQQSAARAALSNMRQQYNMHNAVDEKYEEELKLREENPGVKDAWETYQIMLKLARK